VADATHVRRDHILHVVRDDLPLRPRGFERDAAMMEGAACRVGVDCLELFCPR
jgi:hypothetical protein